MSDVNKCINIWQKNKKFLNNKLNQFFVNTRQSYNET